MNLVVLIGRLTKDPQTRYKQTSEGDQAITRYTLAVDRVGSEDADFISCVCFRKSAEFAEQYLKKGMKIAIEGRIRTGSYENDKGERVYTSDVVVDRHEFCEKKSQNREAADNAVYTSEFGNSQVVNNDGFMNIPDGIDEELPFG